MHLPVYLSDCVFELADTGLHTSVMQLSQNSNQTKGIHIHLEYTASSKQIFSSSQVPIDIQIYPNPKLSLWKINMAPEQYEEHKLLHNELQQTKREHNSINQIRAQLQHKIDQKIFQLLRIDVHFQIVQEYRSGYNHQTGSKMSQLPVYLEKVDRQLRKQSDIFVDGFLS